MWRWWLVLMMMGVGGSPTLAAALDCPRQLIHRRAIIETRVKNVIRDIKTPEGGGSLAAAIDQQAQRLRAAYLERQMLYAAGVMIRVACQQIRSRDGWEETAKVERFTAVRQQILAAVSAELASPPPDMLPPYGDAPELPRTCEQIGRMDPLAVSGYFRIDANGPPYQDATIVFCKLSGRDAGGSKPKSPLPILKPNPSTKHP